MASRIKDIGTIDRRKCRSRAEQLFDAKQMAKNYVELYESLLKAEGRELFPTYLVALMMSW